MHCLNFTNWDAIILVKILRTYKYFLSIWIWCEHYKYSAHVNIPHTGVIFYLPFMTCSFWITQRVISIPIFFWISIERYNYTIKNGLLRVRTKGISLLLFCFKTKLYLIKKWIEFFNVNIIHFNRYYGLHKNNHILYYQWHYLYNKSLLTDFIHTYII